MVFAVNWVSKCVSFNRECVILNTFRDVGFECVSRCVMFSMRGMLCSDLLKSIIIFCDIALFVGGGEGTI